VLIVDPATLRVTSLTTRDRQGGEWSLTFSKLKENQGISDKEFEFRIPRGVDVVTTDD
jgi:outer membrane lipoprotein-sorting protein